MRHPRVFQLHTLCVGKRGKKSARLLLSLGRILKEHVSYQSRERTFCLAGGTGLTGAVSVARATGKTNGMLGRCVNGKPHIATATIAIFIADQFAVLAATTSDCHTDG